MSTINLACIWTNNGFLVRVINTRNQYIQYIYYLSLQVFKIMFNVH